VFNNQIGVKDPLGFTDADFANDKDRKSVYGGAFFFLGRSFGVVENKDVLLRRPWKRSM